MSRRSPTAPTSPSEVHGPRRRSSSTQPRRASAASLPRSASRTARGRMRSGVSASTTSPTPALPGSSRSFAPIPADRTRSGCRRFAVAPTSTPRFRSRSSRAIHPAPAFESSTSPTRGTRPRSAPGSRRLRCAGTPLVCSSIPSASIRRRRAPISPIGTSARSSSTSRAPPAHASSAGRPIRRAPRTRPRSRRPAGC